MATSRSACKLSSYLVRAKLYPLERIVDSHKRKGKRCEVCLNIQEICFSSSVTNETYKINHQFECNKKCLVYLLTCIKRLKQNAAQTIDPFDIVEITTKVTTERFKALSYICKNTCFSIPQAQATMVFSMMFP